MKKIILVFLVCIMAFLLSGCKNNTAEYPFEITVFGVGKADAILIRADGHYMLIDCAEESSGEFLLNELKERSITHLDVLQITHFDKDHVGAAAMIVNKTDIGRIIYPDYIGTRDEYFSFAAAAEKHPNAGALSKAEAFTLGNATVEIYPANDSDSLIKEDKEYDNDLSLVTKITYGDKTFLFCGDIEKARIKQMLAEDTDLKCDWIKMPHHGRYNKRLPELLEKCQPQYAVMTDSDEAPADEKTTELLKEMNISGYYTANGSVVTVSDGKNIRIM